MKMLAYGHNTLGAARRMHLVVYKARHKSVKGEPMVYTARSGRVADVTLIRSLQPH